jgi:hypothetical protein
MSISSVSGSIPQYPTPQTHPDEGDLRESITAKAKEAEALILQAKILMVTALDIQS